MACNVVASHLPMSGTRGTILVQLSPVEHGVNASLVRLLVRLEMKRTSRSVNVYASKLRSDRVTCIIARQLEAKSDPS